MKTKRIHRCIDCAHYSVLHLQQYDDNFSSSVIAICKRPYRGQPINDLTKFQRNIGDPPGSGGAPCGYCGHHAEYFTPKTDVVQQGSVPVREPK